MNTLEEEPIAYRPIVLNSEALPKKPRVTLIDWLKYYAYNLSRKPRVWKKQRQLLDIFHAIKNALEEEVYPLLRARMQGCSQCRDAYMALQPQIFLSQIEIILKRLKCSSHHLTFEGFLYKWEPLFRQSEEIAAWINGFKK